MDNKFEKRKEIVYSLMCDPHYVPMKIKEIAIVMQVAKEDRPESGGHSGRTAEGRKDRINQTGQV